MNLVGTYSDFCTKTIAETITESATTIDQDILMVRPNLWVLPANIDLVGAESELVSVWSAGKLFSVKLWRQLKIGLITV